MPRNIVTTITTIHEYDTVVDLDLTTAQVGTSTGFSNFRGSGIYIGNGIILTAAHVTSDGDASGALHYGFPVRPGLVVGEGML